MVALSAHRGRAAFTLVEMLVVIVIISILAGLLTPAILHALFRAKVVACLSNQRQLYQLGTVYATSHRGSWPSDKGGELWLSLRRMVPPLIEKEHADLLRCPVTETPCGPDETDFRGPTESFGKLKITAPVIGDKAGNHGDRVGGNLFFKDGSGGEYELADPRWIDADTELIP